MSNHDLGIIVLALTILLPLTHVFAHFFERLKQPRLVGELVVGILVGPAVLEVVAPGLASALFQGSSTRVVLDLFYWLGLLLLMFVSGTETRRLLAVENRRECAWLVVIGTPLPFFFVLGLGITGLLPLKSLAGRAQQETSVLLVLAIAVAVTSIPVISRIFYDLGIQHTRFASLILGSAVVEDIILWAVLAVATALAGGATLAQQHVIPNITAHVAATGLYMVAGLTLVPRLFRFVNRSRFNLLVRISPVAYVLTVLFGYTAVAGLLGVNIVFGAFLAGFGLVGGFKGSHRKLFLDPLDSISKIAFAVFIPLYFAMVGYRLQFGNGFSLPMLVVFLIASSILCLAAVGLAARVAGFRGLDVINLAIVTNARGGPGIVLASAAFEAGIINGAFYTTLVLTAVLTSQMAGAWLRFVLSKGWPLLSSNPDEVQLTNVGKADAPSTLSA
jgi:Kef-type K+ transport system membrane component KefB